MSNRWQVQTAKARFSELLQKAATEGPQIVTRRGVETAVVVPMEEWESLRRITKPNLKELLLAPEARIESLAPPRRAFARRPSPRFD